MLFATPTKSKSRYVHIAHATMTTTTTTIIPIALHMQLLILSLVLPLVLFVNVNAMKLQASGCESLLLSDSQLEDSNSGSSKGKTTFIMATLSSYCQCQDEPFGDQADTSSRQNTNFISQLECWPPNLSKFAADFEIALRNRADLAQLKIDYLHISTNMTLATTTILNDSQVLGSKTHSTNGEKLSMSNRDVQRNSMNCSLISSSDTKIGRIINNNDDISSDDDQDSVVALIDHLAIQLTNDGISREQRTLYDDCYRYNSMRNGSKIAACSLGQQLIDFGRLINETHLQFLSIFLVGSGNGNNNLPKATTISSNNDDAHQPMQAARSQSVLSSTNNSNNDDDDDATNKHHHQIHIEINADSDSDNNNNNNNAIENHDLAYDYGIVCWLKRLNNLIRLELNGFTNEFGLKLTRHPINLLPNLSPKLKWLSLARNNFATNIDSRKWNANTNNNNNNNNSTNNKENLTRNEPLDDSGKFLNEQHQQQKQKRDGLHRVAFAGLPSELEFLSLESCKLDQFQVVEMLLSMQVFKANSSSNLFAGSILQESLQKNVAHSRITSLNLALNKLAHLELDFFHGLELTTSYNKKLAQNPMDPSSQAPLCARLNVNVVTKVTKSQQIGQYHYFQLNSLIQLDLSSNKLEEISDKAGQMLLCIAPNLSQLYLNHNKLVHLKLDSFLWLKNNAYGQFSSKLEHLDVSSNELALITTTTMTSQYIFNSSLASLQLKSINFSQNKLTNRPQINQLTESLINLFNDDDNETNLLNLFALFEPNISNNNTDNAQMLSFCDLFHQPKSLPNQNQDLSNEIHDDITSNELLFAKNELKFIGPSEFNSMKCRYVRILRLNQNSISSIEADAFNRMSQLELVDLSENELDLLPETLFYKTRSLKAINLRSNRLVSLPKTLFSHLKQLEEIRLDNNELMQLPISIFEQNIALTTINLASNRLVSSLNEITFAHLNQLEQLKLDGNQLSSFGDMINTPRVPMLITQSMLHNSTSITRLQTQQNIIGPKSKQANTRRQKGQLKKRRQNRRQLASDSINLESKQEFAQIQSDLILSSNQLTSFGISNNDYNQLISNNLCPSFFQTTKSIWLNENRLRQLNSTTFNCFNNLIQLFLQNNLLQILSPETFAKLIHLEHLDLSSNQLARFEPILKHNIFLKYLSVQNNKLERINMSGIFAIANEAKQTNVSHEFTSDNNQQEQTNREIHVINLETLILSFNPKLSIELGDFSCFLRFSQSLRKLQLRSIAKLWLDPNSNSSIMSLNERVQLELVDLSSIKSIHELLFGLLSNHLVTIERLDLSNLQPTTHDDQWQIAQSNDAISNVQSLKLASFISSSLQHDLISLNVSQNKVVWSTFMEVLKLASNSELTTTLMRYQQAHLEARQIELNEWPFDGQSSKKLSNLIELDLSFNKLHHMFDRRSQQANSGHLFGKLHALNLSFNSITTLVNGETRADNNNLKLSYFMPNLAVLDLSNNKIQWISDKFFENLTHLKIIKLSHNQLETIPTFVSDLKRIGTLTIDLAFNGIRAWTEQTYQNFNGISVVNYANQIRFIESLHERFSQCLLSTHKFDIEFPINNKQLQGNGHTPITATTDTIAPSDMRSQFNDANDNGYDNINKQILGLSMGDADEFSYTNCHGLFNSIDTLSLDYSNTLRIVRDNDNNNNSLQLFAEQPFAMSLDNSKLTSWPLKLTPSLSMQFLVKLSINFNELEEVYGNQVCNFYPNLMSLEMVNNKLGKLRTNFANCSRLNYLDLSFNKLTSEWLFARHNLGSSKSLKMLRLRHNELNYITRDMVNLLRYKFPSLRFMDLRDNRLVMLSRSAMIRQFQPRLTIQFQTQVISYRRHVFEPFSNLINSTDKVDIVKPFIMASHSSFSINLGPMRTQIGLKSATLDATTETMRENNSSSSINLRFNRNNEVYELKYCTISSLISPSNKNKICLVTKFEEQDTHIDETKLSQSYQQDCVTFYLPKGIKSCLTNLDEFSMKSNESNRERLDREAISLNPNMSSNIDAYDDPLRNDDKQHHYQQQHHHQQSDIVINSIDAVKNAWIRIRQFDLNQYLIMLSSVQPDNVLTLWNGQPIYTLTVLRISVFFGAIIITALLIAIFFLLTKGAKNTQNKHQKQRKTFSNNCQNDSTSTASPTTETHCFSTPGTSVCYSNSTNTSQATNSIMQRTSTDSNSSIINKHQHNSQSISSSGHSDLNQHNTSSRRILSIATSSSNTSDYNQQLITQINLNNKHELDAINRYQVLDPCSLIANQQNNNCSTPNSSLAPSSVETVETLQAIDSIQSSLMNPSTNEQISSIDQYDDITNNIYTNQPSHKQQQQQQQTLNANTDCPVATVMRMVKSNSSNTFHNKNSNNNTGNNSKNNNRPQVQPIPFNSSVYGTLNQVNYTAFKNKMRQQSTNPPTIYEINPSYNANDTNYTLNDSLINTTNALPAEYLNQQMDSTTLSLQSLNTTLAAAISNPNNQNWSHSANGGQETFCHFHQQQSNDLPMIQQSQSNYNINQYQNHHRPNDRQQQQQQQLNFDNFAFDIISDINGDL